MEQSVTIAVSDILWLAGAIITISAALKIIFDTIRSFRMPNKTQDERIKHLEEEIDETTSKLHHLDEGNAITQRALLALLSHGIDGNDIEAMKKAKSELTDYLIKR